jgi:pyruvate kinase
MGNKGKNIQILAKIQTVNALKNLDEIVDEADGIIISRGSLGCFFRL